MGGLSRRSCEGHEKESFSPHPTRIHIISERWTVPNFTEKNTVSVLAGLVAYCWNKKRLLKTIVIYRKLLNFHVNLLIYSMCQ